MNCNLLKFFLVAVSLFVINSHSFSQENNQDVQPDSVYASDEVDSIISNGEIAGDIVITKTSIDTSNDSLQKWKHSPDFGYIIYLDSLLKKETSLRADTVSVDMDTRKKRRGLASSTQANSNNFLNSFPLQIVLWALAVFFIGFIIYGLLFTDGIFEKRNAKVAVEQIADEPAGLNEYSEYNVLIHEAESKNDYNLSTRYLYLQTLKKLADSDLIQFSPGKTNCSYVKELSNQSYRQEFASLALNYEYVWYGKYIITSSKYREVKDQFILFNKKV
ncbi:MAG: hypothetical protein ABJA71_13790 [Ginsengibacter sp.]